MALNTKAQIGANMDSIIRWETCNESAWKADSNKIHVLQDNVNTFYYFDNDKCQYILKVVSRNNLSKLKNYLYLNRFSYNPTTSIYSKADVKAEIEYQGKFIYLKIYNKKDTAPADSLLTR